ncbi:MAG: PfkB family carbohydrate kinase [Candidatus Aenigmatarchaeota archaeon]
MQTLLTIGSVHIDIFADASSEFKLPNINDLPGSFVISIGGTIFNVASTLKYLGITPFILTALKRNSLFTYMVKYKLEELNIRYHIITDDNFNESAFLALRQNGDLFAAVTSSAWENLPPFLLEKFLKSLISKDKPDFLVFDCNLLPTHIETILKSTKDSKLPIYVCATSSTKVKRLTLIDPNLFKKITAIFLNSFEFETINKNVAELLIENGTIFFVTEGENGVKIINKKK